MKSSNERIHNMLVKEWIDMKFEYSLRGDPTRRLELIKHKAFQRSIYIVGDSEKGTFSGCLTLPSLGDMTVKGSFIVEGDKITVRASRKPSSYTWRQVDDMLRELIERD